MLLGSLAALAHPGAPPQGASAPASGVRGGDASAPASGVRGGDASAGAALGQNPLARFDFGNSSFDLSALSMPSSWWRVKVRRAGGVVVGGGGGGSLAALATRARALRLCPIPRAQDKSNNGPYSLNYTYYFNVAANIDPVKYLPGAA